MTKKTTKHVVPASKYNITNELVAHDAVYVIEKLHKHGFDGYIVGGGIRDLLLGKRPKDFDIVTNATPEAVCKIFKRNSIIIGRRFKIVHVVFNNINPDKMVNNRPIVERHVLEISTYRSAEVHKHSLNEHGKIMVDNNYGTQAEDANRRDFTINALFYDPIKEVIIDYHNGLKDIENRHLRIIGDPHLRFTEDPVRMLRAVRLAIKLNLNIDIDTSSSFEEIKQLLVHEHKSRLYEEMLKMLLSGYGCACIDRLKQIQLPHHIFPLFDKLFLGPHPDAFARKVIEKTDLRLKETADVSIVFILAGLLWNMVYQSFQKLHAAGISLRQALIEAIAEHADFAARMGITKHTYSNMRDVWLLQLEFDMPILRKVRHTTATSRFRQAWHLFSTRYELGQVNPELYNWWNSYIEADNEEKILLLETLKDIAPETPKIKKAKRKRKKQPK